MEPAFKPRGWLQSPSKLFCKAGEGELQGTAKSWAAEEGRRARQQAMYKATVETKPGARSPARRAPKQKKAMKGKLEECNGQGPAGLLDTNPVYSTSKGPSFAHQSPERDPVKSPTACGAVGEGQPAPASRWQPRPPPTAGLSSKLPSLSDSPE